MTKNNIHIYWYQCNNKPNQKWWLNLFSRSTVRGGGGVETEMELDLQRYFGGLLRYLNLIET